MATSPVGDGERGLSAAQRAALSAMSTPAFSASLERMQQQVVRSLPKQNNGLITNAVAARLQAMDIQTSISASMRPLIKQQIDAGRWAEPIFEQIAAQQQRWAEVLAVPLMAKARREAHMASLLATPDLTAALQRINDVAHVRLAFPTTDGVGRVSALIDSGDIDAATLETAEAGVLVDAKMAAAIDEAAEVLAREQPWISRERVRQVVVVWVWLMCTASLVVLAVAAPPVVGVVTSATGLLGSKEVARKAGQGFDRRFPPKP